MSSIWVIEETPFEEASVENWETMALASSYSGLKSPTPKEAEKYLDLKLFCFASR